ncbi:MAG: Amuc_1099 family pilus-like system protein [Verrucomicrobiae bacterium]|nr:Amuc_1099 family pilus-like system protein [Verrucomicrobiae bacterium]
MALDLKRETPNIALCAMLLILILVSLWAFLQYGSFKSSYQKTPIPGETSGKQFKPISLEPFIPAIDSLRKPAPVERDIRDGKGGHQVFVANQLKFDPLTKELKMVDPDKEEVDGIPFNWLDRYQLPKEEGIGIKDPDNDRFSNKEEYDWFVRTQQETSPVDSKFHPDWATKLRYNRFIKEDFLILFKSYNEMAGEISYQINRAISQSGSSKPRYKTEFLKAGESSKGPDGTYKIEKFTKKTIKSTDAQGTPSEKDVSELIITRDDGVELTLTHGKEEVASKVKGELQFPFATVESEKKIIVEPKGTLRLMGKTYKVIDINEKNITIREDAGNEEFKIDLTN